MTIFTDYDNSVVNHKKAQELLKQAKQQEQHDFKKIVSYLQPLVLEELRLNKSISVPDYYLTGEGKIIITSFSLNETHIDIEYGLLAEAEIFPKNGGSLTLHLFKF